MDCLIHQYSQLSPILLLGCCFPDRYFLEVLEEFCLLFPCVQGDPKFSEVLLCAGEQCTWNSSPCLIVSSLFDKEGLHGISYIIPYGLTLVVVCTLHYIEEERIK